MNIGALIVGIGFFITAVFDWNGDSFLLNKKYRDRADSEIKAWQKKRAYADILVGAGAITSYFSPRTLNLGYFAGVIVASIGLVALFILDIKFKKA